MLLVELACFTYSIDFLFFKCRESDDASFGLHLLELLKVDMADLLCHNSMYISTLKPFAYMADVTSCESRINI